MRPTKTLLGEKARKAVLQGVNSVYEPVKLTFGPQGSNALLYRTFNRGSRVTNDGVTVSECQEPRDIFVRLAATAFKEASKKTNEKCGDGTTLTTIIGGRLFNDIYGILTQSTSTFKQGSTGVMSLRKRILESAKIVKEEIKTRAKRIEKLEDLEKIATISVENDELGKIIAKMSWDIGLEGYIDVTDGHKGEIEIEILKGFRFPAKIAAKAFVNNPSKYEMVMEDCDVFLTNYKLDNAAEVGSIFQKFNTKTSKIIVIAPEFSENMLVNMVNATKAGFSLYPVRVPSLRTEQFEDLSIYCGAKFFDKSKGHKLQGARFEDLGFLEKLIVKDTEAREDATALGGKGMREETKTFVTEDESKKKVYNERTTTAIQEHIEILKKQIDETPQDQFKKLLEKRIGSMAASTGVIRVGDSTQASALYTKLKIEDAVYACKAAMRGGYVRGAGLELKEAAEMLPEDDILRPALIAPYEQIQASFDGGLDITEDIIDPAEAIYYAVEHATSVVATLSTVEIITQEIEDALPGEGDQLVANALLELVASQKIHYGQLKEGEEMMWKDARGGLTVEEMVSLDNG